MGTGVWVSAAISGWIGVVSSSDCSACESSESSSLSFLLFAAGFRIRAVLPSSWLSRSEIALSSSSLMSR